MRSSNSVCFGVAFDVAALHSRDNDEAEKAQPRFEFALAPGSLPKPGWRPQRG